MQSNSRIAPRSTGTDMNTLLNGSLHGEEATSPNAEVALDIIPEAKSSKTGVSVRYVESSEKMWYVFRASYNREVKAADDLIESAVYAYVPQKYEMVERDGKRKKILKSLIPNIVFAYMDAPSAHELVKDNAILSFYYNHFEANEFGRNLPLMIAKNDMLNFIRATSTKSSHLRNVIPGKCRYLDDSKVEVIKGDYKGVTGRLARIAGQQCIVVSLANGEFQISTDYIPTPFLRVIES